MTPWELPTSLEIGGVGYAINTDFRTVLYVLDVFADPDYEDDERPAICLQVMYPDWETIPQERRKEALERVVDFIDMDMPEGTEGNHGRRPRLVDWRQDAPMIVPAVNKVLGAEVRAMEYLHWWTFLGAYMEVGDSLFSSVLGIRQKKRKGKPLEKYEQEFYRENRALIDIKKRDSAAETERRAALKKLFV